MAFTRQGPTGVILAICQVSPLIVLLLNWANTGATPSIAAIVGLFISVAGMLVISLSTAKAPVSSQDLDLSDMLPLESPLRDPAIPVSDAPSVVFDSQLDSVTSDAAMHTIPTDTATTESISGTSIIAVAEVDADAHTAAAADIDSGTCVAETSVGKNRFTAADV